MIHLTELQLRELITKYRLAIAQHEIATYNTFIEAAKSLSKENVGNKQLHTL